MPKRSRSQAFGFNPHTVRKAVKAVRVGVAVANQVRKALKPKLNNPQGNDDKGTQMGVITNQYDTAVMYKKKRSKRKKNTFARKVQRVITNNLGDQNLVRSLIGQGSSPIGGQGVADYSMWGAYPSGNQAHDDVEQMFAGYTGVTGPGTTSNFVIPKSANFDWIVSNSSLVPCMLKVWYVYAKKDTLETPVQIWTAMNSRQTGLPNAPSLEGTIGVPTSASPNLGPFISLDFTRNYTISEVRKYFLGPGQVATWRDTHTLKKKIMSQDTQQLNFFKGTKFILLTWHGVGTGTLMETRNDAYPVARINIALQKTYKFAVLRDQYSTSSASNNTT